MTEEKTGLESIGLCTGDLFMEVNGGIACFVHMTSCTIGQLEIVSFCMLLFD